MDRYELVSKIAHGSYGTVFLCRDKSSKGISEEHVAIKMFMHSDKDAQFLKSAVRETVLLQQCQSHSNIVKVHQAYRSKSGRVYLVLEHLPSILSLCIKEEGHLLESQIWPILHQLLQATSFLHKSRILHRDLKPSNIGFSKDGVLKLFDFGLARTWVRFESTLSPYVTTRWYRAPELLVGATYGPEIDIWAIGCILAEMATGSVLFPGTSHMDQLDLISSTFQGRLPSRFAEHMKDLHAAKEIMMEDSSFADVNISKPKGTPMSLREKLESYVSEPLFKVIESCLQPDPLRRPSADDLLRLPMIRDHGKVEINLNREQVSKSSTCKSSTSFGFSSEGAPDRAKPEDIVVEAASTPLNTSAEKTAFQDGSMICTSSLDGENDGSQPGSTAIPDDSTPTGFQRKTTLFSCASCFRS